MIKTALRFEKTESVMGLPELEQYAEGWFLSCDIDQHSAATMAKRRLVFAKLLWFLKRKCLASCGVMELRQFLAYVTSGHKEEGGRWGNSRLTGPVRPRTVHTYHESLRTLFRWIVSEGGMESSPMERIPVPTKHDDQAGDAALSLCSQAAARKRQLLGLPEPDPDREYDPDFSTDDLGDLRKAGPVPPGLGLE